MLSVSTSLLNEFTNQQTLIISGTTQDQPNLQGKVMVTINREQVDLSGTQFRYTYYLQEGQNKIVVTAVDEAGNAATQEFTYFFDRLAPQIVITRPAAGVEEFDNLIGTPDNAYPQKFFVVMGFIRDPDPSSGIEMVQINGQEVKVRNDGSFEFTIDSSKGVKLVAGSSYDIGIVIQARDRAGNEVMDNSRTFRLKGMR
jgi:hypothetical protein